MTRTWSLVVVFGCLFLAGCGLGSETTAEKFQRIAKERALRDKAEAEAKKTIAAKTTSSAKADESSIAHDTSKAISEKSSSGPKQSDSPPEAASSPAPQPRAAMPTASVPAAASSAPNVLAAKSADPSTAANPPSWAADRMPRRTMLFGLSPGANRTAFAGTGGVVEIFDVDAEKRVRTVFNPSIDPFAMALGRSGQTLVLGGNGGGFKIFTLDPFDGLDRFQQDRLKRRDAGPAVVAGDHPITAVAIDESAGLVATGDGDGAMKVWSVGAAAEAPSLLQVGSSDSSAAIVSLQFTGGGECLVSAAIDGRVAVWDAKQLDEPRLRLNGPPNSIVRAKVSPDGRYVAALFEDGETAIGVWDVSDISDGETAIEPSASITSRARGASVAFTSDSRHLVVGGADGRIRAWDLSEFRQVTAFRGHDGPVLNLAPTDQPGEFVSGGTDRTISTWAFPERLASGGGRITPGSRTASFRIGPPQRPDEPSAVAPDPNEAAREALIAGASPADIIERLAGIGDDVKTRLEQSIGAVMEAENDRSASAAELSDRRRALVRSQSRISDPGQVSTLSTFAEGFINLAFVSETDFRFGLNQKQRMVNLRFNDQFLYAALPSDPNRRRKRRRDEPDVDLGDNGALLSWDFKFSRLQAHAWSIDELLVDDLVALPAGSGVLTVPQMMIFDQDGSSRNVGFARSWALSRQFSSAQRFLAVGTAGAVRDEGDILEIFDIADFTDADASPFSRYRGYESVVTAMAFAHTRPFMAFCVRERAVHRLFVADVTNLRLKLIEEVSHEDAWLQPDTTASTRQATQATGAPARVNYNGAAAMGITSLAFSPDDAFLVAQGEYEPDLYRFNKWQLAWGQNGLKDFRKARKDLEKEGGPFFRDEGAQPMRFLVEPLEPASGASLTSGAFLTSGASSPSGVSDASAASASDEGGDVQSSRIATPRIVVRADKGFTLINLNSYRPERVIPYLENQSGQTVHAISDDGRWLVMGGDDGIAYVYDIEEGYRYSVAMTEQVEDWVAKPPATRPVLQDRPAHSGPVVGVAFSPPDPGRDYPAFVATCGEENKVKVWEMYSILDPNDGLRMRRWAPRHGRDGKLPKQPTRR